MDAVYTRDNNIYRLTTEECEGRFMIFAQGDGGSFVMSYEKFSDFLDDWEDPE